MRDKNVQMPFKVMIERCEKKACVCTDILNCNACKKIGCPTFNIEVGSSLDLVGSASVFSHVLRHRLRDGELVHDAQPVVIVGQQLDLVSLPLEDLLQNRDELAFSV